MDLDYICISQQTSLDSEHLLEKQSHVTMRKFVHFYDSSFHSKIVIQSILKAFTMK